MAKKKTIEKMITDLILIRPENDSEGKYYSACTFSRHIGIIGNNQYKKCKNKSCRYYVQLREDMKYTRNS